MFSILIVDDEWTIREGLKRTVPWGDWGITVAGTATNGYEALEILETSHVDILLTDIRMPAMNGLQLIEACRTQFPGLKMVLLTGHDEFEYAQRAIKLGADDLLLKPTNMDELEATMLTIKSDLLSAQQEKNELTTLLIKDILEHNSAETIAKLKTHKSISTRFGFLVIRYQDVKPSQLTIDHVHLIEEKVNQQLYFCHSIVNEEHWDESIQTAKDYFTEIKCNVTLHVSLLSDELEQLVNSYKQASTASEAYYENKYITIYKYHDEKYTLDFEEVIRYIHQHYHEPISQSKLAARLNMSNSYFSKLFKQHTGANFVDFITSKRIEVAKELLLSTTLKTYEIAQEVGYTEPRYFSQIFKKITNQTPIQYRETGGL